MKSSIRRLLAVAFRVIGTVIAFYIGGFCLFIRPVYKLVMAYKTGSMTGHLLLVSIFKICMASTAGGGIWCIFDIISGKFRDLPVDD